ncbi:hypothetical protein BIT28_16615 [Photobacterium proteolyticum]|uniref:Uncharacterized protein n=1 Tax=Photobacterium proteolyticum TaxID=1903952 RepID=A0A1Q9H7H0_9GAMM|nr:hypothetical protein [Photobacterium proteolyticum]OLQ83782.1 hypothetical protein BIT28_16615 [Photobacterium proteolyticum]
MATINYDHVKTAFRFFEQNIGKEINISDVAKTVGWKDSTVQTYFNKKWKGVVLERTSPGVYLVIMPEDMTVSGFADLHTQVDERVR